MKREDIDKAVKLDNRLTHVESQLITLEEQEEACVNSTINIDGVHGRSFSMSFSLNNDDLEDNNNAARKIYKVLISRYQKEADKINKEINIL